ncbi:MAG: TetR/AcrR family transcriptional regulator [Ferrovibrio sp.]
MARKNQNKPSESTPATAWPFGAEMALPATPRAADKIRRTARELFYAEGIRAVGVDEIVTRAGVTKPSLYRAFPSKDELAAAYLRDYDAEFWDRFEARLDRAGRDNPREGLMSFLRDLGARSAAPNYRGCGLSNTAVEYPDDLHPARRVSEEHKRKLRLKLAELAADMGADDPKQLGDGLMLLIEGAFVTGQIFHAGGGPARALVEAAARLIDSHLKS